jgi:hypothetical protein
MINQTMARTFYKDQSPIGRRVRPSGPPSANIPWFTIVGVLKDVKQGGVDKKTGTELYFNFEQLTTNAAANFGAGAMNIVMRTTQPLDALAGPIRQIVSTLDPALPGREAADDGRCLRGGDRPSASARAAYSASSPASRSCWPRLAATACCRTW